MSLIQIIGQLEEERSLNNTLLQRLTEQIDNDIARTDEKYHADRAHLVQRKADLIQEFAERDAALSRLVEGDTPVELPALSAVKEKPDADLAA